ncbi:hypothetical protein [Duganella phyllosphaerae]|uniref:Uncharacterized protein n=1 Tax=Duganella phyllosphaerae TaxID=762836 RepID=A0A1E7W666_9BURK|nr:hypothetical protein [Duganella phyllosphaerae]OEZ91491.1 hypothetical protein DUPY_51030 [Duganella phyllosphaerae]
MSTNEWKIKMQGFASKVDGACRAYVGLLITSPDGEVTREWVSLHDLGSFDTLDKALEATEQIQCGISNTGEWTLLDLT